MRTAIIIAALALSLSAEAQLYMPHPTKWTQTQIDMLTPYQLRRLRSLYPDYIITRSDVDPFHDNAVPGTGGTFEPDKMTEKELRKADLWQWYQETRCQNNEEQPAWKNEEDRKKALAAKPKRKLYKVSTKTQIVPKPSKKQYDDPEDQDAYDSGDIEEQDRLEDETGN